MPHRTDVNNGGRQAAIPAGAMAHYYGTAPVARSQSFLQLAEEGEDNSSPLFLIVTARLDQSLGSSVWSSEIRKVLGRALSEYLTETAYDWGKFIHATHESLAEKHEQRFLVLADEWRHSQGVTSSLTQMVMHPAYQQIIGMGEAAVPLIFRELEKKPDHWFWALKSITGVDPVSEESRGNIRKMAAEWLEWGKTQGYKW